MDDEFRKELLSIAKAINEALNEGKHENDEWVDFILVVHPKGERHSLGGQSRSNFITNGPDNDDVVSTFTNAIKRLNERNFTLTTVTDEKEH